MSGALRAIAVSVEETAPGSFSWVLLERHGEWMPFQRAARPAGSYAKAMAAGLLVLQEMVDDLDAGPRELEPEAEPALPAKRAAFGFGFGILK